MTLDDAKASIGVPVTYYTRHTATERGVITGVGDRYVYVRYGHDKYPKATAPELLELTNERETA